MPQNAVIVGGGVGGLSAAIHLAARGLRVTLLEKNHRLGGKLNLWEVPHPGRPGDRPFRFDTGPSLLTIPLVFQDLFAAAGEDVRDYLPIVRLDLIGRYHWGDGARFELLGDEKARVEEVRRLWPDDAAGFARILRKGESIWNLSSDAFLFHSPEQMFRGRFSLAAALRLLTIPIRIGMFSSFAKAIDRNIQNERLRQLLYQYATYTGVNPFHAPATLLIIPFVEMVFGAWYIPGGMYRLAEALEAVARKVGVEIRSGCGVGEILVENRTCGLKPARRACAVGVRTEAGEILRADFVVANSDVVYTYRNLIDPRFRKRYTDAALQKFDPGVSGLALMLGVEGTYPQLAHHNKFMPDDYNRDLADTFHARKIPDDPCIYVCASTRTDPTQAPDGCENLFILADAPPVDGRIDWQIEGPRYRDRLIQTLEQKWGLTDLSRRIVVQRMISPGDMQSLYNANAGSIYGIAGNSRLASFMRPPNRDRDIAGLYFVGGATHPGGGLPLVALSGKIVSELILEDIKQN